MAETSSDPKKGLSADWLVRGILTRLGDKFDLFTGRKWTPSSSLATSELIERIKKLLDSEARKVPGKGKVVPHNVKLLMQWDRFSADAEEALKALRNELLVATIDHINDSLYYTYGPVSLEVKPDYFIEGVKLSVSYDNAGRDGRDVEMNVTVPTINVQEAIETVVPSVSRAAVIARFAMKGHRREKILEVGPSGRISIGRTGSNDLVLNDTSVSKVHAALVVTGNGQLSLADTGSTNGTFINGERIAYGKATKLVEGDLVRFGTVEVTFESCVGKDEQPRDENAGTAIRIEGFEFRRRETAHDEGPGDAKTGPNVESRADADDDVFTADRAASENADQPDESEELDKEGEHRD
jgi:pSer/pThr/pTyr-binding forkhead associated (FHA) protein